MAERDTPHRTEIDLRELRRIVRATKAEARLDHRRYEPTGWAQLCRRGYIHLRYEGDREDGPVVATATDRGRRRALRLDNLRPATRLRRSLAPPDSSEGGADG